MAIAKTVMTCWSSAWKVHCPSTSKVAVIGCVVNGPGETREADLGVAGGSPDPFYVDGKPSRGDNIDSNDIADKWKRQVRAKIELRRQLGLDQAAAGKIIPDKTGMNRPHETK